MINEAAHDGIAAFRVDLHSRMREVTNVRAPCPGARPLRGCGCGLRSCVDCEIAWRAMRSPNRQIVSCCKNISCSGISPSRSSGLCYSLQVSRSSGSSDGCHCFRTLLSAVERFSSRKGCAKVIGCARGHGGSARSGEGFQLGRRCARGHGGSSRRSGEGFQLERRSDISQDFPWQHCGKH